MWKPSRLVIAEGSLGAAAIGVERVFPELSGYVWLVAAVLMMAAIPITFWLEHRKWRWLGGVGVWWDYYADQGAFRRNTGNGPVASRLIDRASTVEKAIAVYSDFMVAAHRTKETFVRRGAGGALPQ